MKFNTITICTVLLSLQINSASVFAASVETANKIHYLQVEQEKVQSSNFNNFQKSLQTQNDDSGYVYLFNTTIRSAMAETIYVMAHNKKTGKWDYLGEQLSAWDPATYSSFLPIGTIINADIAIKKSLYDEIYVNGYSGTWSSDHMKIDTSTAQSIKTKVWWEDSHLKVYLYQFNDYDWG
ncbi:hypothetical protein JQC92_20090 [Shewanella sp. 202IG2-18]|uniref:hypothetical protein n=1 Tax=Parashewanella hymeniacidonis TaxID=2807618 RepID=UPI00195FB929|nr:hypothetical protein [Parashewanella hymeniacidonis]MBM7074294.1 hypothetical protein [Parashewanella hymeniacidonis]